MGDGQVCVMQISANSQFREMNGLLSFIKACPEFLSKDFDL